jgi:signal transduction histidine kinase
MNDFEPASVQRPDADLAKQRSEIRRGLNRANLASVIILIVVIGLSLGAVLQAFRAERNAQEAQRSRRAAEADLLRAQQSEAQALLDQSRAQRRSGQSDQRSASLAAVTHAATLQYSPALLDEAIAVLALPALQFVPVWTNPVPTFFQFAPDFGHFAVRDDGEIKLLTTQGANNDITLPSIGLSVEAFWFSPDGRFGFAGYWARSNIVWNLQTRSPALTWGGEWRFHGFSSDSARVIITHGPVMRCLALADGQELWRCPIGTTRVSTLASAPRGHYFALADVTNTAVQIRNVDNGDLVQELPGRGPVASLTWSLDGKRFVVGRATGWVEIWDAGTWAPFSSWRAHDDSVAETRFDPMGRWLVSASWDRTIRFWSLSDFRLEMTVFGYDGHMVARFSPDGARFACARARILGYLETSPSQILRWLLVPPADMRGSWSLDISPDGKLVAAGYAEGLRILDLDKGRQLAFEPINDCRSALFTPDGKGLVTSGAAGLGYWPLDCSAVVTNGSIAVGPRQCIQDRPFMSAALTPDGRWIVAANRREGLLEMFEVHDPTNHVVLGSHPNVQFVAVSPDGQWLASGTWYGRGVRIWDIAARHLEKELPSDEFAGVAFSPDSRMLVTSERGYRFWECGSWRECYGGIPDVGALGPPCAFSPDGRFLALMKGPHTIELCDRASGRVLAVLQAPGSSSIDGLRFNADSTRLVALEWARQVEVWELPQMREELGKLGLDLDPSGRDTALVPLGTNGLPVAAAAALIPSDSRAAAQAGPRMFGIQMGTWFYILPLAALALGVTIALYTLRYHQRMMHSYENVESLATERNQALHAAQAELMHSQKMRALGTLAAGIAHDFNNLLSIIRMGNNFLRRRDISSDEKAESGQAVERAVDQGKQIVRSMLGYSREPAEEDESYSVLDLVNEAGLLLNQQFLRGITLTLELNRDLPSVMGRRGRLQQILLNLMVNASEAMNGQGRLRIAAQLRNSAEGEFVLRPGQGARYIELVIEDTGPGIDPQIKERVFEPFFSTKPRGASSGTGLGLSLVHSLAQQEKIGIRLESAPGRGTIFTLWIPVIGSEAAVNRDAVLAGGVGQ